MKKIQKLRNASFKAQSGHCYYCQQPMWQGDMAIFAQRYSLSDKQALFLRATAEHLDPRSEGGEVSKLNIVAACNFCNAHRHRSAKALLPERYLLRVRARLAIGKWHGIALCSPKIEYQTRRQGTHRFIATNSEAHPVTRMSG
jgi:hypothetical protein